MENHKSVDAQSINPETPYRVAIIGAGPKGLYGLERLLANLSEVTLDEEVEIHMFNRCSFFGAGDIYRHDQPEYLLMNYANGFINAWPNQAPKPIVDHPLSFVEWLKKQERNVSGNEFSSRSRVGEYLCSAFEELKKNLPRNVRLLQHTQEVCDIEKKGGAFWIKTENEAYVDIQHTLLATGHSRPQKEAFSDQNTFVEFVYPVQEKLSHVTPNSKVAIKGIGLTFIDTVLALTEGRGGRFNQTEAGFKYVKSGNEPIVLYPFSKSGLPMMPRSGTFGLPSQPLYYFTPENLCTNKGDKDKYDFEKDILPLIKAEIKYAYYRMLFQQYNQYLHPFKDIQKIESEIDAFHERHPIEKPFSFNTLFNPLNDWKADRHEQILNYVRLSIREGEKGEEGSPLAHAAGTWRRISNDFNELYSFGGLSPKSHRVFLSDFMGQFNRVAYGPPIENMKKIMALAEAGLIDFSFAHQPNVNAYNSFYVLTLEDGSELKVDYLIDARIPKTDMVSNPPKLYQKLIDNELATIYNNGSDGCDSFSPGCIHISREGHPINALGEEIKQITLTGTPTEGITFDNDTLSRNRNDFVSLWGAQVANDIQVFTQSKILEQS